MKSIGIIAEDISDVEVLQEIIKKIAGRSQFTIQRFIGNGSGKIKSKCLHWANILKSKKCDFLILIRDLDNNNISALRNELTLALNPSPILDNIIVIPIREIEAWLLADHQAIEKAMNLKKKIGKVANPEALKKPKEHLRDLIYLRSGKSKNYLNTIHNKKIASEINLDLILARCSSYASLHNFIKSIFNK